jgi:predicted DNA-binding antitoxin AbrB/MazE fold protein
MTVRVDAVYENGVLRPRERIDGLAEHARVQITVETQGPGHHPLSRCMGTLPDEDAAEMTRIVDAEFEGVNPDDWR